MLDAEALTCLLVLLFIDEPKLNTTRLHRVLRNLCYHGPTRAWLIRALLSIVQKAGDSNTHLTSNLCVEGNTNKDKGKGKKSALSSLTSSPAMSLSSSATSFDTQVSMQSESASAPNLSHPLGIGATTPVGSGAGGYWLSISLEAALGCRANVFQIHRTSGKKMSSSAPAHVSIHPQAAPVVCRHALDTLISLAKVFPTYFLPAGKVKEVSKCEAGEDSELGSFKKSTSVGQPAASQSSPKAAKPCETPSRHEIKQDNDFWSILVRLDSTSGKSKGKGKEY